jgi:hypothetical protein
MMAGCESISEALAAEEVEGATCDEGAVARLMRGAVSTAAAILNFGVRSGCSIKRAHSHELKRSKGSLKKASGVCDGGANTSKQ